jgi:hypothetical protein
VVRTISRKRHEIHELIEEDRHHKVRQHILSSKCTAANATTRIQRSTRFLLSAEHDDAIIMIFWRISLSLATAANAKSDAKCTQYLQFWTILSTHRPTI